MDHVAGPVGATAVQDLPEIGVIQFAIHSGALHAEIYTYTYAIFYTGSKVPVSKGQHQPEHFPEESQPYNTSAQNQYARLFIVPVTSGRYPADLRLAH
ncbi:hypothetical protein EVAR_48278_1 [Eumeta japonica]|uniref:Uncharacterized protein n=1 Tax=Eumeta variegata TaxID=151549 RepID=A0A4C1WNF6_EUMVA|nr:hypothetical protein EVAR_48278_1 [Eumeta japonica]